MIRVALVLCLLLPIIYLVLNYSESHKKINDVYHSKFAARKSRSVPVLVDGPGNFEPQETDLNDGPGEGGEPYALPAESQNAGSDSEMEYGMNMVVSDAISLDRSVKDTRLKECKRWNYPEDLPSASVIIVFHNEGLSVLMRTVHSVINRTPPQFLHEIVLVDDYSDKNDLKDQLDSYIKRFDGKVRLIRNVEREGLIRTRSR
jgi:polypeptide N-acetylgalactosaminyltransferase